MKAWLQLSFSGAGLMHVKDLSVQKIESYEGKLHERELSVSDLPGCLRQALTEAKLQAAGKS